MAVVGWEWIVITVIAVVLIYYLFKLLLRRPTPPSVPEKPAPTPTIREEKPPVLVREREVIREVVKIRCPYCKTLYEESLGRCPKCGSPA